MASAPAVPAPNGTFHAGVNRSPDRLIAPDLGISSGCTSTNPLVSLARHVDKHVGGSFGRQAAIDGREPHIGLQAGGVGHDEIT